MKTFEHLKADFESFVRAEKESVERFEMIYMPLIEERLSFVEWRLVNTADFMIQMYHFIAQQHTAYEDSKKESE